MSEILAFIQACLDRTEPIVKICDRFGISEKTGHKRLKRFREEGLEGLPDRSRARLTHPYRIGAETAALIIALRRKHPLYGPQTLHDILIQREPEKHWPAASSIGELLKRENLIPSKRRRHHANERAALDTGRTRALEPNLVWTASLVRLLVKAEPIAVVVERELFEEPERRLRKAGEFVRHHRLRVVFQFAVLAPQSLLCSAT